MQLALAICLPRDGASIPVARHIIRDALRAVGVAEECIDDIAVAQTEACANVVQHSGPGDEYEVRIEIDDDRSVISVIDKGHGFDSSIVADGSDVGSERGRGILLMRALVDDVHFVSEPDTGTAVRLEKALHFRDDAVFGGRSERSSLG
jgi:serine/threonine-protein kinase RsbW